MGNDGFVQLIRAEDNIAILSVASGTCEFVATSNLAPAAVALKTSKPKDNSTNLDRIDLSGATKLATRDFATPSDVAQWIERKNVEVQQQAKQTLRESDQVNAHLFRIRDRESIEKICFDPFTPYDKFVNVGGMMIESITVYQLADEDFDIVE